MREEALRKQELKTSTGKTEIVVWHGYRWYRRRRPRNVKAILEFVDSNHLENIIIRQTGNIGIDSFEPVVQVILPGQEKVTYGHVSPEIVKTIMEEHVIKGKPVSDYQVKS
jgi:NADP-reducing hydrogenase subunit HndB